MEITSQELEEKIKNKEKLVIDFWGEHCGPCKIMKPVFEKVGNEYMGKNSNIQLYTMDVAKNRDFVVSLGIRAVPTIKIFVEGEEVYTKVGMVNESQINDMLTDLING